MSKHKINPEVNKKEADEQPKPNETEAKAPEVTEDAEVVAAAKASQEAAEKKQAYDEEVAAKKATLKGGLQVNAATVLKTVGESKDLITAVKQDAEKRGKTFSVCPISGVLVVG